MNNTKQTPNFITDWTIVKYGNAFVIYGKIYNDMKCRFSNGTEIHTSRLEYVDFVNGVAKTKNSMYNLEIKESM